MGVYYLDLDLDSRDEFDQEYKILREFSVSVYISNLLCTMESLNGKRFNMVEYNQPLFF